MSAERSRKLPGDSGESLAGPNQNVRATSQKSPAVPPVNFMQCSAAAP